jgi:hypothetical protein
VSREGHGLRGSIERLLGPELGDGQNGWRRHMGPSPRGERARGPHARAASLGGDGGCERCTCTAIYSSGVECVGQVNPYKLFVYH